MKKIGKVINIEKNKVYIITSNKEFITVEKNKNNPIIGEVYVGEEFKKPHIWKTIFLIAIMLYLAFMIRWLYLNNKYNYSIIVDMNCSIKMEVNGGNRIKKVEGISSGGFKITETLDLHHKSLNEALCLILDESIKQKYLTKAHAEDGFELSIFVSDNKNNTPINLTEFKKHAATHNFKVLINNNGQAVID